MQDDTRRKGMELCAVIVLFFCEWFFFRNVLGNGGLFGDRGDGRLLTLLAEHWWNFFTGREHFSEIAMFYPFEAALGYSDMLFGYGLIHSAFRLFGLDMFEAYKWTLVSVHVMGTASMYYLMRKKLNCGTLWSLFGTMAFSFSNTYTFHAAHTQLFAISCLPIMLILIIGFIENFRVRRKRNYYAYSLAAWFVMLAYNSWYIAFFTYLFGLIYFAVYSKCLRDEQIEVITFWREKLTAAGKDAIGWLFFAIVLFVPFLYVYIPAVKTTHGYSYKAAAVYIPEFADIINVSKNNWLLGQWMEKLELLSRKYSPEVCVGFSVILLGLFLMMYLSVRNDAGENWKQEERLLTKTAFFAIIVSLIISVRLSANGVSLWWLVYKFLPCGNTVRSVARFWFWLSFPMAVVTAYTANMHFRLQGTKSIAFSCLALAMLFASNVTVNGIYAKWDRQTELDFITHVAEPPKNVGSFYIIDSTNKGDPEWIYQLDAFEIAVWHGLKTINGYSGHVPPGGEAIASSVNDAKYEISVLSWVREHGLNNVYAYDRGTNRWISFDSRIKR